MPVAKPVELAGCVVEDLVAVVDQGVRGQVLGVTVDLRADELIDAVGEPPGWTSFRTYLRFVASSRTNSVGIFSMAPPR